MSTKKEDKITDNKDKQLKEKRANEEKGQLSAATEKKDELTILKEKQDETFEQLLRAKAETENIKKRAQKEIESIHKYSNESLIQELIPIYDSLDLCMNLKDKTLSLDKLIEGNNLLLSMFTQLFEKNNILIINPLNEKFDPKYHQAISTINNDKMENEQVAEVVQKGFSLNDRIIRPALVIVIKN